jgi:hypothetical protein
MTMTYIKYYFFSLIILLFIACGQDKPAKVENTIDTIQITKQIDTLQYNSDTFHWLTPKEFTPSSFLNAVIDKNDKDTIINVITMEDDFPVDWVKHSDIDTLVKLITSTKKCKCFLNPLSSYIPTNKNADIGGYAIIFINSFRQKSKINLGLYSCPTTDQKSVEEITKWWTEYKKKK